MCASMEVAKFGSRRKLSNLIVRPIQFGDEIANGFKKFAAGVELGIPRGGNKMVDVYLGTAGPIDVRQMDCDRPGGTARRTELVRNGQKVSEAVISERAEPDVKVGKILLRRVSAIVGLIEIAPDEDLSARLEVSLVGGAMVVAYENLPPDMGG